jgi:hypothetical protein
VGFHDTVYHTELCLVCLRTAPPPQPGPGISVTRTFKVGDQVMFRWATLSFIPLPNTVCNVTALCERVVLHSSRDTVKATVFGSHIAPPTMSLEEYGDRQRAEALEREAQRPEDGAAHANRK